MLLDKNECADSAFVDSTACCDAVFFTMELLSPSARSDCAFRHGEQHAGAMKSSSNTASTVTVCFIMIGENAHMERIVAESGYGIKQRLKRPRLSVFHNKAAFILSRDAQEAMPSKKGT